MSRPRLIALLLAFITGLVFLPTGQHGFVNFDDNEYLTDNPMVKNGLTWAGIKWAFTTFSASNWHPVTWLSHMVDCELFSLNAGAHHLVNVLFHAANAALVFGLLFRLTNRLRTAAFIAALFAWHPLHVESVAWISERKDVMSAFFALLTLFTYTKFARENKRRHYWLALGFFALGLMSKPMVVTLPWVMLLLDFWPLGRIKNGPLTPQNVLPLVREKIPFFLLTAASCVITLQAQHAGHAVVSLEQLPISARLGVALMALAGYIGKLLWPANLCALYLLPKQIPALPVLGAATGLAAVSFLAWRWRNSRPYFFTGWLWFAGMLVPVLGLVQVGDQIMADRYTYLPAIGFFIALVFLANEMAGRVQVPAGVQLGFAGLVSCACILATEKQLPTWRNGEALFRQAVAVNPANDTALINLGVTLSAQGRFEEAVEAYQQAVKTGSQRVQLHNNLGNALGRLGRNKESLAEYLIAVQLAPQNPLVHFGIGRQLAALGQLDAALGEFAEATRLAPSYAAPQLEAGKVLFKLGRDKDGLLAFQNAVRLDTKNFQTLATAAHYLAANDQASLRDGRNALLLALKADELARHKQPVVMDILGMAYAENGDFTNAITRTQQATNIAAAVGMNSAAMQRRISLYQSGQPWRESFRMTNLPASW